MLSTKNILNLSNRQINVFDVECINKLYGPIINYNTTTQLTLSSNQIENTCGFQEFTNLTHLDLSNNKIKNYFQLPSSLLYLDLSDNQIGILFQEYQKMLKSQGTRQFTGALFKDLYQLKILKLSNNKINTIPSTIFEDQNCLEELDLNHNKLNGSLWFIVKLTKLKKLNLAHNSISNIQDLKPIEKLIYLEQLDLSHNPFENQTNQNELFHKLSQILGNVKYLLTIHGQCQYQSKSPMKSPLNGLNKSPLKCLNKSPLRGSQASLTRSRIFQQQSKQNSNDYQKQLVKNKSAVRLHDVSKSPIKKQQSPNNRKSQISTQQSTKPQMNWSPFSKPQTSEFLLEQLELNPLLESIFDDQNICSQHVWKEKELKRLQKEVNRKEQSLNAELQEKELVGKKVNLLKEILYLSNQLNFDKFLVFEQYESDKCKIIKKIGEIGQKLEKEMVYEDEMLL